MERSELKAKAKAQLKGKWPLAIGSILVATIISSLFSYVGGLSEDSSAVVIICQIISLILGAIMTIGICQFSLNMSRSKDVAFSDIFSGFNMVLKAVGLYLLSAIIIGIGFVLLIVPGIILALMFSQAFYIMTDNRDMSIIDCLKNSAEMMKGHKGEYFVLILSFIGWAILAAIPLGLGYLWLMPYMNITFANYYLELSGESQSSEN